MPFSENPARKFFLLEGRSREIAQRVEQVVGSQDKMSLDELREANDYLSLFKGTVVGFHAQGSRVDYYPVCPALHRSQHEPENYYLRIPVSDFDGSHYTPKDAIEISDPQKLARLDSLFAEGADMIYCHPHREAPFTTAQPPAPASDRDEGPQL
ncbi:MAG: hypothetical protein KA099_03385 [Alphaproteobacteria bacterium]|nr:hypothetical protein [Alphaproteobacteria bacterium]MBP7759461.1 hypothetical protein [Alphaproteobacteria bacterium]MBP7762801.1 hypothetical protein [Alphaproteobacteria bacterium]MBP7904347.1 hypothetical protein [Alphaproteobacteria bacterium]